MQIKNQMTDESLGAQSSLVLQLTVPLVTDTITQHAHHIQVAEARKSVQLELGSVGAKMWQEK